MSTKSSARLLRVFLCHSSADKPIVREINLKLKSEGWVDPWLDEEEILAGQDWDAEIKKAVNASDAVIVFLSKGSVAKEGYVQKELRSFHEASLEKPENTIYLLPLRIEECSVPSSLQSFQYTDYFPKRKKNQAYDRLLQSLRVRAKSLGINTRKVSKRANLVSNTPKILRVGPNKSNKTSTDPKFKLEIVDSKSVSKSLPTPDGHYVYTYGNIKFVRVPAGTFIMGSKIQNPLSHPDERPQLPISIPYDYFIGRYPVTVSQYLEFIEWNALEHEWEDNLDDRLEHPVTSVSWERARDFCKWLNDQHADELPLRSGVKLVFRLPTEPEWEKAARGEKGWEWPWGNEFDKGKCNSLEADILTTTPVGKYSSKGGDSPYGAADMAGNVWEWTNTLYARYPYRTGDGRENRQGKGLECVVRGGCYRDQQKYVRTCYRYMIQNFSLYYFQGLRVVIAPPISSIV